LFDEMNKQYVEPKLVMFTEATQSGCGFASSATGPFYCPSDEKVYIDLSFFDEMKNRFGAGGDFAMAYVIAHEVGHHVQNLLGITRQVDGQRGRVGETEMNRLSVKLELQADFLAGVWAHYDQQYKNNLDPGDIEEALNAGTWAIGVSQTGNMIGLTEQDWRALPQGERAARLQDARLKFVDAGAHYVIDTLVDLKRVISQIEVRLHTGERP